MSVKISRHDLKILLEHLAGTAKLARQLRFFLAEERDDYYFYGTKPLCAQYIVVAIHQLGHVCPALKKHHSLCEIIRGVYNAGIQTRQQSIFLYGRDRT